MRKNRAGAGHRIAFIAHLFTRRDNLTWIRDENVYIGPSQIARTIGLTSGSRLVDHFTRRVDCRLWSSTRASRASPSATCRMFHQVEEILIVRGVAPLPQSILLSIKLLDACSVVPALGNAFES